MTTVITGWSPKGFVEYGFRFVETFHKHWPADVNLISYTEERVDLPRGECRSLWDCVGAREFYERHKDNREHSGREPNALWRQKDTDKSYSWRFDTLKWFRQCLIPNGAAGTLPDGELMIWLDADVVTLRDVPVDFVEGLIGDADLVYLGRKNTHSEIGFWAVRLNARTRDFLKHFADMYRGGAEPRAIGSPLAGIVDVFDLPEWHSAYVFDRVREDHETLDAGFDIAAHDLTPGGRGHVWHSSPLTLYTDHLKGNRKQIGFSPERKRA